MSISTPSCVKIRPCIPISHPKTPAAEPFFVAVGLPIVVENSTDTRSWPATEKSNGTLDDRRDEVGHV